MKTRSPCAILTIAHLASASVLFGQSDPAIPGEPVPPPQHQAAELPGEGLTLARMLSASAHGCRVEVQYVLERIEETPITRTIEEVVQYVVEVPDGMGGTREEVRERLVFREVTEFRRQRVREPRPIRFDVGFGACGLSDSAGAPIRPRSLEHELTQPRPAVLLTSDQTLEDFYRQLLGSETIVVVLYGAPEWFHRGMLDETIENYKVATGRYSQAILQNPDYADAYDHRAACYQRLNNPVAAIADYTEFIRIRPEDPHGYFKRGEAHVEARGVDPEHMEFALADYSEFIRRIPKSPDGYLRRGEVYREIREYGLAIGDLTRLIELTPADPLGYQLRAECHRLVGNAAAAASDERRYNQLINTQP